MNPDGPICHTGNDTCFFTSFEDLPEFVKAEGGPGVVEDVFSVIQDRKRTMQEGSYTAELLGGGVERISQKVIEEAGEAAIAAVKGDAEAAVSELGDLVYHALVLLAAVGARPEDVWEELRRRQG